MNRKKKDSVNLLFSAFLVTAFIVCASFLTGMVHDSFSQDFTKHTLLMAFIFVLFGLMLFYATRVGDGKQVRRFSLSTLIVMVLPALYVIIATVANGLPFHDVLSSRTEITDIAAAVLGYGIPYTFLSGYELDRSECAENTANASAENDADSTKAEPDVDFDTSDTDEPDTDTQNIDNMAIDSTDDVL